jgi:cyclic pyranopterin phosphate synthase
MAQQLRQAGLARLNISVDSLKPNKFREMTRNGDLSLWYEGIVAAKRANFTKIKLNTVVLAGFNDDEVIDLAHFAVSNEMDISFIEEMPLGSMSTHDRSKTQVSSANIREKLETKFHLIDSVETTGGPSRYSNVVGSTSKIGFISPMSNNFCESCNRVRMTAEGRLLLCLGNEHSADLRSVMRSHPGDQNLLKNEISKALKSKPERHYFDPNKIDIVRFMNMTGG